MGIPKGFGVSHTDEKNYTSRSTNYSVQTADKTDSNGTIVEQVTHGGVKEVQEEFYCDDAAAFENPAVNGQSGETVVTSAQITESSADFCKASVTKRTLLPAADGQ